MTKPPIEIFDDRPEQSEGVNGGPPLREPFDDLYERYVRAFRRLQSKLAGSNAPLEVKRSHLSLDPLVKEHFEAEIACGTERGRRLLDLIYD